MEDNEQIPGICDVGEDTDAGKPCLSCQNKKDTGDSCTSYIEVDLHDTNPKGKYHDREHTIVCIVANKKKSLYMIDESFGLDLPVNWSFSLARSKENIKEQLNQYIRKTKGFERQVRSLEQELASVKLDEKVLEKRSKELTNIYVYKRDTYNDAEKKAKELEEQFNKPNSAVTQKELDSAKQEVARKRKDYENISKQHDNEVAQLSRKGSDRFKVKEKLEKISKDIETGKEKIKELKNSPRENVITFDLTTDVYASKPKIKIKIRSKCTHSQKTCPEGLFLHPITEAPKDPNFLAKMTGLTTSSFSVPPVYASEQEAIDAYRHSGIHTFYIGKKVLHEYEGEIPYIISPQILDFDPLEACLNLLFRKDYSFFNRFFCQYELIVAKTHYNPGVSPYNLDRGMLKINSKQHSHTAFILNIVPSFGLEVSFDAKYLSKSDEYSFKSEGFVKLGKNQIGINIEASNDNLSNGFKKILKQFDFLILAKKILGKPNTTSVNGDSNQSERNSILGKLPISFDIIPSSLGVKLKGDLNKSMDASSLGWDWIFTLQSKPLTGLCITIDLIELIALVYGGIVVKGIKAIRKAIENVTKGFKVLDANADKAKKREVEKQKKEALAKANLSLDCLFTIKGSLNLDCTLKRLYAKQEKGWNIDVTSDPEIKVELELLLDIRGEIDIYIASGAFNMKMKVKADLHLKLRKNKQTQRRDLILYHDGINAHIAIDVKATMGQRSDDKKSKKEHDNYTLYEKKNEFNWSIYKPLYEANAEVLGTFL